VKRNVTALNTNAAGPPAADFVAADFDLSAIKIKKYNG
jgi:hypothetical protein